MLPTELFLPKHCRWSETRTLRGFSFFCEWFCFNVSNEIIRKTSFFFRNIQQLWRLYNGLKFHLGSEQMPKMSSKRKANKKLERWARLCNGFQLTFLSTKAGKVAAFFVHSAKFNIENHGRAVNSAQLCPQIQKKLKKPTWFCLTLFKRFQQNCQENFWCLSYQKKFNFLFEWPSSEEY